MSLWLSMAVFLCVWQISRAQSPSSESVKTIQVRLKTLGWQPPEPMHRGEFATQSQPFTIDHDNRIIIGYTVREREGMVTREQPAFSFHILRFAPDGRVNLSLALPTNNLRSNGVYLDQGDDVIAHANDEIQLLLKTDETEKPLIWQELATCGVHCEIRQSFSRSTLALFDSHADPPITILEGTPLLAIRCLQPIPWRGANFTLSSSSIYFTTGAGWPEPPPTIHRWPLCGHQPNSQIDMSADTSVGVFPLNDDWLAVGATVGRPKPTGKFFGVVSSAGREKFRLNLPKHDHVEILEGDERGDRFATSVTTWKGGSEWLDISPNRVARRIVVYETATGKEVSSFAVTPHALIDLAMSPDGHRVAVLANDTVTIADIP